LKYSTSAHSKQLNTLVFHKGSLDCIQQRGSRTEDYTSISTCYYEFSYYLWTHSWVLLCCLWRVYERTVGWTYDWKTLHYDTM